MFQDGWCRAYAVEGYGSRIIGECAKSRPDPHPMMPIKRPTKGLDVVVRRCSAKSFTKNVIDELIKAMLTKNR